MAQTKRKKTENHEDKQTIKSNIKDIIKASVQPPAKAVTPPESQKEKTVKKKK